MVISEINAKGKSSKELHYLLEQHIDFTSVYLKSRYGENPTDVDAQKFLDENSLKIAEMLLHPGDSSAVKEEFIQLWQHHSSLLIQYIDSVKEGKNNTEIIENIKSSISKLVEFMGKDKSISKSSLKKVFIKHLRVEKNGIVAYLNGKHSEERVQRSLGTKYSKKLALVLVHDHPSK